MNSVNFFTPVQEQIRQVEDLMRQQAADANPELQAALEQLLASGGKRFRPTLTLLTGQMLGAAPERLITLAAAMEMLHTATLVHDDLIDGALLRRGNPTLNSQWAPPATVLTGDFIFARAAKLAAETDHLPLMKIFAGTLATIVNGELTQMFSARGLTNRENYYKRIYAKTGSLLELTTRGAAMISPVGPEVVESMRLYGYYLGMAFQIVDDVLDFAGEQAEIGKPVGSDLIQGLVTLPAIYYAESHPDDPDVICLSSGCYNDQPRMDRLVQAVRLSAGISSSLEEATDYIEKAVGMLDGMPAGIERQALEDLARYTVNRKS